MNELMPVVSKQVCTEDNSLRNDYCKGVEEPCQCQCGKLAGAIFDGDVLCAGWRISVDRWCSLILSVPSTSHPPSPRISIYYYINLTFSISFSSSVYRNAQIFHLSFLFVTELRLDHCLSVFFGCSNSVQSVEGNIVLLFKSKKWLHMHASAHIFIQSQPSVTQEVFVHVYITDIQNKSLISNTGVLNVNTIHKTADSKDKELFLQCLMMRQHVYTTVSTVSNII